MKDAGFETLRAFVGTVFGASGIGGDHAKQNGDLLLHEQAPFVCRSLSPPRQNRKYATVNGSVNVVGLWTTYAPTSSVVVPASS